MTGNYLHSQAPVANFTTNVTSGCAPLSVTFFDQSTGNPTSWNWEFSNGTLSNVQNPSVSFNLPGTYSVKLVVQNASGISQVERINYITVSASPAANFSANMTLSCAPGIINFTDLSTNPTGTITSWEWDFGDGGTSTLQNPTHTYNNVGFYAVTLTVTSSTGCKHTVSKNSYIRIVGGVSTDFNYSLSTSCRPPYTANFQNFSSGPGNISYTWNFGNSTGSTLQNPSTVYSTPGTYIVRLDAQSDLGCVGSTQQTITITETTTDFIAPPNICLNQPVVFQNSSSSPPVSSYWTFGDGTFSAQINPVKTFLVPGNYNVKVVNQYTNCTDSITKPIVVNDQLAVNFIANDSTSCQAPFTVQFTDLTAGATSWLWDFGDGNTSTLQNPSHQYIGNGNYTVSLTATTSTGCSNTFVKPAYIKIQPVSIGINVPAGGCIPFTYTPQANITTLDPIVSYAWDLGEPGAVSNLQNPAPYTYTSTGSFTISLTVTTQSGCVQTQTIPGGVLTGVPPVVNFSASPINGCASDTISFTNLSTTTPGATVTYLWDFGDGGTSSLENPQHVFTDTGAVTVAFYVSNNRCVDTLFQVINVLPPVALFNYTVDCTTQLVTFRDSSLADPSLPLTYLWQMGDAANTQFNVQHPPPFSYSAPGTYSVSLTVTNGPCSYTTTREIVIASEPADFTISKNPVCKNEVFQLAAVNSNANNISTYTWTVNGTVLAGTDRIVSHALATSGTYDVTLTITDVNGCVTTRTIPDFIAVNGPTASFSPATPGGCVDKSVTFTDQSTPAGSISQWNFNFGDGNTQVFTAPPFTHTYNLLGGFQVSLTVTDNAGCQDTYTLPTDLLVTSPTAGFRADTFYCPGAPLQFVDTSAGVGLTYLWNFGDGNTSTLQNPQNSYPLGDASYTVSLVITDMSGCQDSVRKIDYIKIRSPKAAFDIKDTTTICPPLRTSFTFQGTDYQSFYWDFGDGGLSTQASPSHFYSDYGTFTPKLYLIGPGGCIDSAESSVTVHNPFTESQVTYGPVTTACNSLSLDINIVVPDGFKFHFYSGDGLIDSSQSTSFTHFYSRPGFNEPRIVLFDPVSGCQVLIVGAPPVRILGAVPLFGMDKTAFCDSGPVVFTDFTTKNEPIISTVWNFGDGNTSGDQSPTHNYTAPGTYIATLNITTESNCSSSYSDTVRVYRTPQPLITGRDTICVTIPEAFNGSTAVTDTLTEWLWNFGNGQTATSQNHTITYNTAGDYSIQLITTNLLGCSDTIVKSVHVTPPPTATPVEDPITIISGAGTDLLMNYTGNIASWLWTPNTRLTCNNCATPFATPQSTTTYDLEIVDTYGCRNRSEITVNVICNKQNFFVPNTFSPNGDGQNDIFYPRGSGLFRIKSMLVFNRWGQVVYERKDFTPNDAASGWNGTFKGQNASADVYIYTMEILCDNNTVIPVKGNVTLLR